MLHATLFVEFLRSRPQLTVWAVALLQGLLWTLVPTFFYAAPPGGLSETIVVGREFQLATYLGPPLAYWLADIAYSAGKFGVYLLAQACVVVTYWAVFKLGSAIVGARHAAFAVVLMGGIYALTVPTPEFGPSVLAMALWSLALLHYRRASEEGRLIYWLALGLELGLLLLTTYAAFVLIGLLIAYMLLTERGRVQATEVGPWISAAVVVVLAFPLMIWLDHPRGAALVPAAMQFHANPMQGLRLFGWLVAAHAGLAILVLLGFGFPAMRKKPTPMVDRVPVDPHAKFFIYFFALTPIAAMTIFAMLVGGPMPIPAAPLVIFSGLAVMVAAPDSLRLVYQRLAGFAWALLVVGPPLLAIVAVTALPWIYPLELKIGQPAAEMGRFFADSFQRRTGKPLAIVTGDESTAALIAFAAPSKPSLYLDAAPERTPWVSKQDIESKGAVVVWQTTDTAGAPPPAIRARYPDLVPDVPRSFPRLVQGRLPVMRIGWAVIRPRGQTPEPPTPPAPIPLPQTPPQVQPQSQPQVQPQVPLQSNQQVQPQSQPELQPPPSLQELQPQPRQQQQRRPPSQQLQRHDRVN